MRRVRASESSWGMERKGIMESAQQREREGVGGGGGEREREAYIS